MKLDADYWDERYRQHETGWDLGEASPALCAFIDGLKDQHINILIPGCGNAYEAEYLLKKGFTNITVLDISPSLTDSLKTKWENVDGIKVRCEDFFEHEGEYDLMLEQTFFCAINPVRREQYCQKSSSLLKDNGMLVGLLFNRTFPHDGPPFGGNRGEYQNLFSRYFSEVKIELCESSIAPRMGSEVFIEAKK